MTVAANKSGEKSAKESGDKSKGAASKSSNQNLRPGDLRAAGNQSISAFLSGTDARPAARPIQRKCSCGGASKTLCPACRANSSAARIGEIELSSAMPTIEQTLKRPGAPIPDSVIRNAAPHLAGNIGQVRAIHDAAGNRAANAIGADAFTSGQQIVFGAGKFDPASRRGRALLAHELEHVRQQKNGTVRKGVNAPNSPQERAADKAENAALHGFSPTPSNVSGGSFVSLQEPAEGGGSATIFVNCDSETSGTITFVVNGASHSYDIGPVCRFPQGRSYTAGIVVSTAVTEGDRLNIAIRDSDPEAASASFQYTVRADQEHPGAFMRNISSAEIIGSAPPAAGDGTGTGTLGDDEEVRFQVRELSAGEFARLTGTSADQVPEGQMTDLGLYTSSGSLGSGPNVFPGLGSGLLAGSALTPGTIVNAPPGSEGLIWSRNSHVMAFGTGADGGASVRGYRYSAPRAGMIMGSGLLRRIPGLQNNPFLTRTNIGANTGVPGAVFNESLYMQSPFSPLGDQVSLYRTPGLESSQRFIGDINAANNNSQYTYPRPPAQSGVARDMARLSIALESCTANNCLTVFEPYLRRALGGRSLWAVYNGQFVDVFTGLTSNGTYVPEAHGSGPLMEQALGLRPAPGQEGWRPEAVFSARQDAMQNQGLNLERVPRGRVLARNLGVGVIRNGGRVLLIYGAYRTTQRISEASGTPRLGRVVSEEAGAWSVGTIASIIGASVATGAVEGMTGGAIVCSPSGPGSLVCAAVGFAGGAVLGLAGGVAGHYLGGSLYDYAQSGGPAGTAVRFVSDQLEQSGDEVVRQDGRALRRSLLGGDTGSTLYLINRFIQSQGGGLGINIQF